MTMWEGLKKARCRLTGGAALTLVLPVFLSGCALMQEWASATVDPAAQTHAQTTIQTSEDRAKQEANTLDEGLNAGLETDLDTELDDAPEASAAQTTEHGSAEIALEPDIGPDFEDLEDIDALLLALSAGSSAESSAELSTESPAQPPREPEPPRAAVTPHTIDLLHPPTDLWERIRRGFAIPNLTNAYTLRWTKYYAEDTAMMQRMLDRASRYLYYIVDEIESRGLPTELALLPFVESAFNPTAYSRAHASGLWQFIPSTGQHYKLQQDKWRDLRRDPIASTQAALDYLSYLFEVQGEWHLALASYNWGEGSVKRAIQRNTRRGLTPEYVSLKMPAETRHYIPKLQAIKNIISHPEQYGLTLPVIENTPYFTTISDAPTLSIFDAAKLAEMPLEEFRALNASFNHPLMLAEHKPTLLLPTDKVTVFQSNLQSQQQDLTQWKTYRARAGETYTTIAKKFGLSAAQLRKLNGIPGNQNKTTSASLLVLPADPSKPVDLKVAQYEPIPALTTYTVKAGDTLSALARRYNTTVAFLRKLNNLQGSLLRQGARLRVPARTKG